MIRWNATKLKGKEVVSMDEEQCRGALVTEPLGYFDWQAPAQTGMGHGMEDRVASMVGRIPAAIHRTQTEILQAAMS